MKILKIALGLASLATLIASCGGNSTNSGNTKSNASSQPSIEQLTNYKTADKQQLFLRFVSETETDSSKIFVAKSLFDKDTVGLQVEVLKNIKPGINAEGKPIEEGFVKGQIKLSSIGEQSDALVKAFGTLFNKQTSGVMTKETLLPTVFSSNKVDVDLSKQATYSFKLFFENVEGAPAEIFATVDTYRKSFELSEINDTHRGQLISAFESK